MSKKFENLPKKLLESFRIVNYTTPEYIYIIRGYLMAIGMENSCVFAKKIILFFDLIVGNIGNKLFLLKQDIEKQDIKRFGFNSCLMRINLVQIVKILEKTSRNLFERKNHLNDIEIEKEIRIEIKSFLKCLISKNHWTEVEVILDCVFGKQQDDKVLKNKENLKRFKKILTKFLNLNGIIFTKKFYKYCKILVEVITQGNSLFICGKVGIGKSTLIKAAAYVISFLKSTIFFQNFLLKL